jgi:non-heme chloroperoxidase
MPFVETADHTNLYYTDWGAGPAVVLIHGWPMNVEMWEHQIPALVAQGLRCIAYDRRGFGRSSHPEDGYDYDTFADDLATLLDALDLRDVTLVGYSMGGGEVARYLARHGVERVARAALVGAIPPFLLRTADNPGGIEPQFYDDAIAALTHDRAAFLADAIPPVVFGDGPGGCAVTPDVLRWVLGLCLQASPHATIACVRAFSQTDFRDDLRAVTVPTLIVHGDADLSVPIDLSARVAARLIPGCRLVEYAGAPHGLFVTEAERLNRDLVDFVLDRRAARAVGSSAAVGRV